jgi:hypothetical protein
VCEHGPDPVGRPDVARVVLQHILEVVDGAILILSLLVEHNELLCCGSGSVGSLCFWAKYKYGSGSGSFYHQAKIVRKALFSTVL